MNIGLIGLPKAGKTTIFNALTGQHAEVAGYASGRVEPNVAVVDVLDDRVDRLSALYNPRKTVRATIEFIDFVAAAQSTEKSGLFSGEGMALIKTTDALLIVLRNFSDLTVESGYGRPDPRRDLDTLEAELLLADQILVERRLERLQADHQRGKKTPQSLGEERLMSKLAAELEAGRPLRGLEFHADELRLMQGYRFVTTKPVLVVLNSGEDNYGRHPQLLAELGSRHAVIEFAGDFEMELSTMEETDQAAFMADMGIGESARARLTKFAYSMLGYISFFTVGEDEVRAWTIRAGERAVEAAGAIHSDLARGFIRAEVFTFDDIMGLGSEKAIKEKGLFRLEGKEYLVKDGDILHVRFSV